VSPLAAALLGIVQGLTEFLPISSSAHLILARDLFGLYMTAQLDLAFDVACHIGTLLAVVTYFWSDLLGMARALPAALTGGADPAARRIRLIAVGTLPIVIVGLLGGIALEDTLRTPVVAAVALAAGSFLLLAAERVTAPRKLETELTYGHALLVGIAQSAALVPGVSRSGATIATAMFLGYRRAEAAKFTFLLSIPAILAAAAKNGWELRGASLSTAELQAFAIGLVTSAVVGYLAIKFLLRYLAAHRLDVFAWYRLILAGVLLFFLVGR
jgi:undecaprenyl-diphosphatase